MNSIQFRRLAALIAFGCASSFFTSFSFSDVIGYWRFEGDLTDSSGNGLTLTTVGGAGTAAIPGSGPGSKFSNPIPGTGSSNTGMTTDLDGVNDGYRVDDQLSFAVTDFTIEAFIRMDTDEFNTIASQFGESPANNRAWRFVTSGSGGNRFLNIFVSEDGTTATQTNAISSLAVSLNTDYYAAAVVDIDPSGSNSSVTYYLQDLTNGGPLQSETVAFGAGLDTIYDSTAYFLIGASISAFDLAALNNEWDGRIDEVRWSNTALGQDDLLITAIPEPASLALLFLGSLLLLRIRLHRGLHRTRSFG